MLVFIAEGAFGKGGAGKEGCAGLGGPTICCTVFPTLRRPFPIPTAVTSECVSVKLWVCKIPVGKIMNSINILYLFKYLHLSYLPDLIDSPSQSSLPFETISQTCPTTLLNWLTCF